MQIPYLPCLISIVFVLERQVGFEGMNQAQLMRKHSQLEPKLTLQPAQSTPTPFPWITGISPVYEHGGGAMADVAPQEAQPARLQTPHLRPTSPWPRAAGTPCCRGSHEHPFYTIIIPQVT